MSMSGSPKLLYSSANDPENARGRYISTAINSFPPTAMLEKHFALSPTELEHPRFNPLNRSRPYSSALLNVNDPMAMHLLVETAIIDSAEYEVLSFEEVEELKKELKFLIARIDAARRKLALESKVRDAALSLSRLYNNKKGKRRSLLGANEVTQKTDEELIQSNQKVEQLVQELWGLNNRAVEIQRRLLQHAAGILGMTHQGGPTPQDRRNRPSAPTSPLSAQMHSNGRSSGDSEDFDDRSFYHTSENLDGVVGHPRGPSFEQLRHPMHRSSTMPAEGLNNSSFDPMVERRLEQLNNEMRNYFVRTTGRDDLPGVPLPIGTTSGVSQQLMILEQSIKAIKEQPVLDRSETNMDLEDYEQKLTPLWDMLILGNERKRVHRASLMNGPQQVVDSDSDDDDEQDNYGTSFSIDAFSDKVQTLYTKATKLRADKLTLLRQIEQQKQMVAEEREMFQQKVQTIKDDLGSEVIKLENEVESLNEVIQSRDNELTAANQELDTLTDEIKQIQEELRDRENEKAQALEDLQEVRADLDALRQQHEQQRLATVVNSRDGEQEKADKQATAELLKQQERAEGVLLEKLREKDEEIMARVETENQLRALLKEKEEALAAKVEEEQTLEQQIQEREQAYSKLGNKYHDMSEDLIITKAELDASKAELEIIIAKTNQQIQDLEQNIEQLNSQKSASDESKEAALQEAEALRAQFADKNNQLSKMEQEVRELVDKIAGLSTEVALLKAELDQAYGSKKERAAATAEAVRAAALLEAANKPQSIDPAFLEELDTLANENKALLEQIATLKASQEAALNSANGNQPLEKRNQLLQAELSGMIQDFENLTKQSIEFESERSQLETVIDNLRNKIEVLETSLTEEKLRMLGSRNLSVVSNNGDLPVPPSRSAGESMSTQVLKTEFKKIMRDMRADQNKLLRAEQEERRKLEGIIRKMKQEQIQQRRSTPIVNSPVP